MVPPAETVAQAFAALATYRMRVALTILGITMGVSTLITVMTLIQGANRYVETKVANLGANVFQVSRLPFTVTDFHLIMKAFKNRRIEISDMRRLAERCRACLRVGASATASATARHGSEELRDVTLIGHTANMAEIDTRTVEAGRYFTPAEEERSAPVCLIGWNVRERLFPGLDPLGRSVHVASMDCQVSGVFEKVGSVFGQDQDSFVVLPMQTFLRLRGRRSSLTLHVLAPPGRAFEDAQLEVRQLLRAIRHVDPSQPDDFFLATKESYIELWRDISSAFFVVFVLVSTISAVVGGVVIMNVMLMSVTDRRKEIGIRRAVGATRGDVQRQFLAESVLQCLAGGTIGIGLGFLLAAVVRRVTEFPIGVELWVAVLGIAVSSAIGIFFGLYPARRAALLDPVVALHSD